MAITRLSGGTTPPNGSDPRTFPAIFNAAATDIEAAEAAIGGIETSVTALEADITTLQNNSYSKTNILGTVSETSGVPTGAIIETGTNSNGTFFRYANGTQICTFRGDLTHSSFAHRWTYPASFTGGSVVALGFINRGASDARNRAFTTDSGRTVGSNTTAGFNSRFPGQMSAGVTAIITDTSSHSCIAIGRWF